MITIILRDSDNLDFSLVLLSLMFQKSVRPNKATDDIDTPKYYKPKSGIKIYQVVNTLTFSKPNIKTLQLPVI